jgi:hypothetical protein
MTKRRLTPEQIEDQQRGSTRIAPGVWRDRDGCYHFSILELLAMVDLEDTPANRDAVEQMIRRNVSRPGVTIIRQEPEP